MNAAGKKQTRPGEPEAGCFGKHSEHTDWAPNLHGKLSGLPESACIGPERVSAGAVNGARPLTVSIAEAKRSLPPAMAVSAFPSADSRELPQFVRDLLGVAPSRGAGLNVWLFRAARVLHAYRAPAEIVELLRATTHGEPVQVGEIERAVERSMASAYQLGRPRPRTAAWPLMDVAARAAIVTSGAGLVDLWEASPVRWTDEAAHTEKIIDALFPADALLCVGLSQSRFDTASRQEWRGQLSEAQFVVPSPMSARTGRTQDGRESAHTLANTGPRRFLVIEQDAGSADEQAALLLHLAERAPLALAVHSGGKSIHGWFYCAGRDEGALRQFMHRAVSLGADRATWTRSQFVRMPDGLRESGPRQTVYFFNPEVVR